MRALIPLCLLLLSTRVVTAAPVECTREWAVGIMNVARGKSTDDVNKALQTIGACENGTKLLVDLALRAKIEAAPATTASADAKSSHSANTHAAPDLQLNGQTSSKKPAQNTEANAPIVDRLVYAALLNRLKVRLLQDRQQLQHDCSGFIACEPIKLKTWLETFIAYLSLIQSKDAPENALREAGDLIASVASQSPEVRRAQAITDALGRMSPQQRAAFRTKFPKLKAALDADNATTRLISLLEHPGDLQEPYAAVAAIGPSRAAVGGRAVIVSVDYKAFAHAQCGEGLEDALSAALDHKRPIGVKIYDVDSEASALSDVSIVASIIDASPDLSECPGKSGEHCVKLTVQSHLSTALADEPSVSFHSPPYGNCERVDQSFFDAVAKQALDSFSVAIRAADISVDVARLIRAGCVEVVSEGDAFFAEALRLDPNGSSRVLLLQPQDADWRGFSQELAETLTAQKDIVGETILSANKPATPSLWFTWNTQGLVRNGIPDEVDLTVHWNGDGGPPDAHLRLTPKERRECAFKALSLQQTIAAEAAFWLIRLHFHGTPTVNKVGKDWALAPTGLLLSGLPQLLDVDPDNNLRGAILTGVDLALITSAAVLVLLSVDARANYSATLHQSSLDRANNSLRAGQWFGGLAIVPRVVSILW